MQLSSFASRALVAVLVATGGVLLNVSPAAAPSPFADAVAAQLALGYQPCTPVIAPLPQDRIDAGDAADADNGEQSGTCMVRVAWDLPGEMLETVTWHEICHLSTGHAIWADPASAGMADPAHEHEMFGRCLGFGPADTGGY